MDLYNCIRGQNFVMTYKPSEGQTYITINGALNSDDLLALSRACVDRAYPGTKSIYALQYGGTYSVIK